MLALAALLAGASVYMLDYSLCPPNRSKDLESSRAYMRYTYPQIISWMDSLECHKALHHPHEYTTRIKTFTDPHL